MMMKNIASKNNLALKVWKFSALVLLVKTTLPFQILSTFTFFAEKCRKFPIRILPYVNYLLMVLHPWCLGDLMFMPQVT